MPWECLNQAWAKAGRDEKVTARVMCSTDEHVNLTFVGVCQAPNIMAMIQRFNVVSRWVATEIVQVEDITLRASVLNHFLEVMNVRAQRRVANFVYSTTLGFADARHTHTRPFSDAWSSTTSTVAWRSYLACSPPRSTASDRRGRYT
jgi:hypothetical protein